MSDDKTPATLHEVLARGIEKGLRDVGAELSGCTPSTLTGHIIRELLAAGLHPGPSRKRTLSATEPQWRIGIEVPMRLPGDMRHDLFERVAALVHVGWEPESRDGWDANVYGCPVADDAPDHLRSLLALVLTELLRGGSTYRDRCQAAYAALAPDGTAVCAHGWPRALLECPKCHAPQP